MAAERCPRCSARRVANAETCPRCQWRYSHAQGATPSPVLASDVGGRCPNCSRYAGADAAFCPHCGVQLRLAPDPPRIPRAEVVSVMVRGPSAIG
jgi:hypothetical protein